MRLARVRRTHRQAAAVNNGAACPGTNLSAQPQTPLTRVTDATNSHATAPHATAPSPGRVPDLDAAEKFGRIEIGSSYGPKLNDDGRRLTCCY
jgi:hypothetical protein